VQSQEDFESKASSIVLDHDDRLSLFLFDRPLRGLSNTSMEGQHEATASRRSVKWKEEYKERQVSDAAEPVFYFKS